MTEEKILRISKEDLDADNFYKEDSVDFNGRIEIESNLGCVRFKKGLYAKLSIFAEAGTGIKAGEGIISGLLMSPAKIIAKWIDVKLRICAGFNCKDEQEIDAEIKNGKVILGKMMKK